jgi:hypothetical protein
MAADRERVLRAQPGDIRRKLTFYELEGYNILYTFHSTKTIRAIPTGNAAVRDALIHLTLDHNVVAIDYFGEISSGNAFIRADSIFVRNASGRHLLEILPSKRSTQQVIDLTEGMGIHRLTITDAEIRGEPRHGNEMRLWQHVGRAVPVHLRMQILSAVHKRSAVSMGELLASLIGLGSTTEAVLALACVGIIRIDLNSGPISPHTLVRSGD